MDNSLKYVVTDFQVLIKRGREQEVSWGNIRKEERSVAR